jgi:putative FmdB family regulatory protein
MPTYSYICDNCNNHFELFFYIKDYVSNPTCPVCRGDQTSRHYQKDIISQNMSIKKMDSELKTIGDLANRNRDRMSDSQKHELHQKHNAYKDHKIETKQLPTGMSYTKKPNNKYKWRK